MMFGQLVRSLRSNKKSGFARGARGGGKGRRRVVAGVGGVFSRDSGSCAG